MTEHAAPAVSLSDVHRPVSGRSTAVADRATTSSAAPRLSRLADGIIGSRILRIAAQIRALVESGHTVYDFTVGDFRPAQFPIPDELRERLREALARGETNYPPPNGVLALREAVRAMYANRLGVRYGLESILIACGARPGLESSYRVLTDPGDRVVFPVPSWNNEDYCHIAGTIPVRVPCSAATAFLPTRAQLEPLVGDARMIVLSSPLNPTGTTFDAETLADICDLVIEENARRSVAERPLYLLYDQVYWMLTLGDVRHVHPVGLRPDVAPFTVYIDAISKSFAATGLRVGWIVGPPDVIQRMGDLVTHSGAWAPRAEQIATAEFLGESAAIDAFQGAMRAGIRKRLDAVYGECMSMRAAGLPVEAIPPTATMYLTARFALSGARTAGGALLDTTEDIRSYLLDAAGFGAVPLEAFGMTGERGWFRLSVGAVSVAQIEEVMPRLRTAIAAVQR
jgi:aspartate aminotransferase